MDVTPAGHWLLWLAILALTSVGVVLFREVDARLLQMEQRDRR